MRTRSTRLLGAAPWLLALWLAPAVAQAKEQTIHLEADVADAKGDFVLVPFDVPAGIVEIEVRHGHNSKQNVLDFGLESPDGFRGWGGGNSEPAIVGEKTASRSYLAGPIKAGRWNIVVGRALIVDKPATYSIDVILRDTATLPAQPDRGAYKAAEPLEKTARWYAGDFHVHSRESGDAKPTLDEIAKYARETAKLDFVVLTEHNTVSERDYIVAAQKRHPKLLLIPGIELTTYKGHAGLIGASRYVDHKIGVGGRDFDAIAADAVAQGALVSINHPVLDLGSACLGCSWQHPTPRDLHAVEIATGGFKQSGFLFAEKAIAFWDKLVGEGRKLAALGGSDDHNAGTGTGAFQSPIGQPTTMVFAQSLSAEAIIAAVRAGRTVVKLQAHDDPMVDITVDGVSGSVIGQVVDAQPDKPLELVVTVTGGKSRALRLVVDGKRETAVDIDADPFVYRKAIEAPATEGAQRRVRAEVLVGAKPRTVSSHVWVVRARKAEDDDSGCAVAPRSSGAVGLLLLLGLLAGVLALQRRR